MSKDKTKKVKTYKIKSSNNRGKKTAINNENAVDKKKKERNKNVIFTISGVSIVLLLILISFFTTKTPITYSIAKDMTSSKSSLLSKDTIITEEGEDTKFKHSFIECANIYNGEESEENRIVSISLYDTKEHAEHKKEYFEKYNKYLEEKYKDTIMEEMYIGDDAEFIIIDNYFLNISNKYSDHKEEIIKMLKKYKDKYEYKPKDKISTMELDKYWDNQLENTKKEIDSGYEQRVEELKKQIKEDINKLKDCSTVTECRDILESYQSYENYKEISEELKQLKEEYNKNVIIIPDFSTMSKQDAINWLTEREMKYYIEEEYSDTIPENRFIKQSEKANSEDLKKYSITLTYSKGRKPTQSELNALNKAQSYSDHQYMSKNRLYQQLISSYGEGFSAEEAQYAIDHVKADWNYNALQKGKSYYTRQNMSKSRVYQQLVSPYGENFTPEQAQYAVDHLDD